MKTKNLFLLSFVFAVMVSFGAQAAPSVTWADGSAGDVPQTMDPQMTSGGAIEGLVAGDFNCDGYDDLAVNTGGESRSRYGKVYIHLGSATYSFPSDLTDADYEISGTTSGQYFGYSPVKIATVDSDACPELVVSARKSVSGSAYGTYFLFNSDTISSWTVGGSYTVADADSSISMGVASSNNYDSVHNVGAINGEIGVDEEYLAISSGTTMYTYFLPTSALVAGSGTVESNSTYSIGSDRAYQSITGGDFDGDGQGDLLVGYAGSDPDTLPTGEDSFLVIFGPLSDSASTFGTGYYDFSDMPSDGNIKVLGDGGDIGSVVQPLDMDGDGKDEILVSDSAYDSNKGVYYLISGLDSLKGVTNEVYADTTSGSYNFASSQLDVAYFVGDTVGGYIGGANNAVVADFDGDGYEDSFLGGQNYSSTTGSKGRGYVLYNRHTAAEVSGTETFEDDLGTTTVLSATNRADAYIQGASSSDYLATKVITGDFDGDGDAEIVTYAYGPNSNYGQLAVVTLPNDVDGDTFSAKEGDCNDEDATVGLGSTWFVDADADGLGNASSTTVACTQPNGYVSNSDDCDDTDETAALATWYDDADADGFGDATTAQESCTQPSGTVSDATDCDDTDATVNPDVIWYVDADADGFGGTATQVACTQPTGYVATSSDCNDADASETPDTVWYADADADGFGSASATQLACTQPAGYVEDATDCNDTDATINPDAVWYEDADSDNFGNAAVTLISCAQPSGYVTDATDTDDSSAAVYPGATEVCDDSLDNDSNGLIDTADTAACSTDDADADGVTSVDGDCDDADATVYPGASEIGDAIDNDCDGSTDEALTTVGINTASVSTLSSGTYAVGDTLNLDIDIDNRTGLTEFQVQVWVPSEAYWTSTYEAKAALRFAPGSFARRVFCNITASNCDSLGTSTVSIPAGSASTVTVPLTIPTLDAGDYVVRVRVVSTDTGEVVGYFRNAVFTSSRVLLEVIQRLQFDHDC